MQRTRLGGEELAWAATEPLARRIAALKSWRAEVQKSLDDDELFSSQTVNYRPEPHQSDNEGAEESAFAIEEGGPTGVKSNKGNPNSDVTRLHDNPERTQNDISDQSDQDEKDWKILF